MSDKKKNKTIGNARLGTPSDHADEINAASNGREPSTPSTGNKGAALSLRANDDVHYDLPPPTPALVARINAAAPADSELEPLDE